MHSEHDLLDLVVMFEKLISLLLDSLFHFVGSAAIEVLKVLEKSPAISHKCHHLEQ